MIAPLVHAPTAGPWSFGRTPSYVAPRDPDRAVDPGDAWDGIEREAQALRPLLAAQDGAVYGWCGQRDSGVRTDLVRWAISRRRPATTSGR